MIFINTEFVFLIIVLSGIMPDSSFTIKVSRFSGDWISFSHKMIISLPEGLCVELIDLIELLCVSFESVDEGSGSNLVSQRVAFEEEMIPLLLSLTVSKQAWTVSG